MFNFENQPKSKIKAQIKALQAKALPVTKFFLWHNQVYDTQTFALADNYDADSFWRYKLTKNALLALSERFYNYDKNTSHFFQFLQANPFFAPITIADLTTTYKSIFDKLKDKTLRKITGAFFTPPQYVQLATNMLRAIIENCDNYLIVDRCAGTGNLESMLTATELQHCILNTYELNEWNLLQTLYSKKVYKVLPTNSILDENHCLQDGNLLMNKNIAILQQTIADYKATHPNCTVVFYENPPYSIAPNNNDIRTKRYASKWTTRDILDDFLFSAFHDYKLDHYIVFGPIKYWKTNQTAFNYHFDTGYLVHRHFFNTTKEGCLTIAHWTNQPETVEKLPFINSDTGETTFVYRAVTKIQSALVQSKQPICKIKLSSQMIDMQPDYDYQIIDASAKNGVLSGFDTILNFVLYTAKAFGNLIQRYKYWAMRGTIATACDGDINAILNDKAFVYSCVAFARFSNGNTVENEQVLIAWDQWLSTHKDWNQPLYDQIKAFINLFAGKNFKSAPTTATKQACQAFWRDFYETVLLPKCFIYKLLV